MVIIDNVPTPNKPSIRIYPQNLSKKLQFVDRTNDESRQLVFHRTPLKDFRIRCTDDALIPYRYLPAGMKAYGRQVENPLCSDRTAGILKSVLFKACLLLARESDVRFGEANDLFIRWTPRRRTCN